MNPQSPQTCQPPVTSQHLMAVTERPAQVFVRGQGAWLWDESGRRYLDWLQGWAVNALGHCPPEVAQALQVQSGLLLTPSPALYNVPEGSYATDPTDGETRILELKAAIQALHEAGVSLGQISRLATKNGFILP